MPKAFFKQQTRRWMGLISAGSLTTSLTFLCSELVDVWNTNPWVFFTQKEKKKSYHILCMAVWHTREVSDCPTQYHMELNQSHATGLLSSMLPPCNLEQQKRSPACHVSRADLDRLCCCHNCYFAHLWTCSTEILAQHSLCCLSCQYWSVRLLRLLAFASRVGRNWLRASTVLTTRLLRASFPSPLIRTKHIESISWFICALSLDCE